MRRLLLLLRHAKAERAKPGGRDHERVLEQRGRADAGKIGVYLVRHGFVPDRALVSTAERTRETWTLAARAFDKPPAADFDERIYEASPQSILKAIQDTVSAVRTLLVIGHNPGLQELAAMLIAAGDIEARQRLKEHFPTSALAAIGFSGDWSGLRQHAGRLDHFVTPRSLEATTD
jgi:phosphohistidine phosphatase